MISTLQQPVECDRALLRDTTLALTILQRRRKDRARCKRYVYGDQWKDRITVDGRVITEQQYIAEQGNIPLKNNLIRRIVRNVLGVFRDSLEQQGDSVSHDIALRELHARTMEEFLIGGVAVYRRRKSHDSDNNGIDYVSPASFFYDPYARDPTGADMTLVGECHNIPFEELTHAFARNSRDYAVLCSLYPPSESDRCRVYEVWRRERRPQFIIHDPRRGSVRLEDGGRGSSRPKAPGCNIGWRIEDRWHYYFFTPEGRILASGRSPLENGSHPYVFTAYPFIDGEVHSFVGDLIDQQRYTNRLITLYDWVIRASAKGVLLFPEDALPAGMVLETVVDEWSRHNGVILYTPRPGTPVPQQISSNSTKVGIGELLEIQLKMLEDVSGVSGALQGKLDNNAMSGTLYDTQTRNALTALRDLLDTFMSFLRRATS